MKSARGMGFRGLAASASCVIALAGCASGPVLPPTPNLYVEGNLEAMNSIAPERRSPEVEILYGTDREPTDSKDPAKRYYDHRRSDSLAIGRATVRIGKDMEWDELFEKSLQPGRRSIPLEITEVEERIRFPSSITLPMWTEDGDLDESPEFLATRAVAAEAVSEEVGRRLAGAECKEVFVYIHGVGNSFTDPIYRMAELWHFLGRPGVPVVYTWPAIPGGGLLRGYTYARESSEFTVYHLRQFLQSMASCPDVERVNIIAHSRGTGATLSVLRDLRLIYLNDPARAKQELKLGDIILAAPDIDLQVAQQRFRPDQVFKILDRLTLYLTPDDKALGIAEWLFNSLTRLGATTEDDLSPEQIAAAREGRLGADMIEVKVRQKGSHGHTYWIDNPSVLSDVILLLRDSRAPGAEHGRPLLRAETGFWEIYDGYPYEGPHAEEAGR